MKKALKKGVSGIMRVCNEENFIVNCVHSCISALDELIIVYNDCTDGSENVIRQIQKEYPDKIKVFKYPYVVMGIGLTREQYKYVKSLALDSPHLLCNYYNFALDKVSYEYAIKIDADQLYFAEVLKEYCNLCRLDTIPQWNLKIGLGYIFQLYFSVYRNLSMHLKRVIPMMPVWLARNMANVYKEYAIYQFLRNKACLSFSGFNIVEDKGDTFISLGLKSDTFNVLPPFNGEGDHVLFKISDETFYQPFDMWYYNDLKNASYSIIEIFKHPYRIIPVGYAWLHINAQRAEYHSKVLKMKMKFPEKFVNCRTFFHLTYSSIMKHSDKNMFNLFQRVLFGFVYKAYGRKAQKYVLKHDKC